MCIRDSLYSTFARGMALKDPPPRTFVQILERLWWRLDKTLGPEDVYISSLDVYKRQGRVRGVGFAASYRGVSLGAEGVDAAGALVSVQPDGSVCLHSGLAENGQGLCLLYTSRNGRSGNA